MSDPAADRNLLFGILALQMEFITRDALLAAMNACALDPSKPLGQVLVDQGALAADRRAWLEIGVEWRLAKHGNDLGRSLSALGPVSSIWQDLRQVVDFEVQTSQVEVSDLRPDDVPAAGAATVGTPTPSALRYRILRSHATGGLGEVFVAHDEELHREVALKEIQDCHADRPESRARFLLEAEITGGLEHPGIVPVYGLGAYPDGRPYYAMRFIRGDSLKDAIDQFHQARGFAPAGERLLRLRQLLGRFVDVCQAVAYAHSRGVLHRDLKPANVLLGNYGETLVMDWGLAKPLGHADPAGASGEGPLWPSSASSKATTRLGSAVGTPAYMSPEQAAGRLGQLGPPSDVYSLGATLYSLLTGQPPFGGGSVAEVLSAVKKGNFPPPRQAEPGVPAALEAVCLKAMALLPEDRYPSAQALAQDVERWLADEPVSAWREPLRVRAGRWVRRHQAAVTATAAAALVALLLGGGSAFLFEWQWVARRAEQARQEASLRQGIQGALAEVAGLERKGRWGEARTALAQAVGRLGDEGPPDLLAPVGRVRDDLDLVAWLDDIRLRRTAVVESGEDLAGADRSYAKAFTDAGLAREGDDPGEAAGRVRASLVRGPLVAALDDWAHCARSEGRRAWLLEVARKADPNPWRDRARQPAVWRDRDALQRLLAAEEATDQSPQLVAALCTCLADLGGDAVGVLRRAQARHRDDFWLNFELGLQLDKDHPAEAAGYYRAALALRPDTAAVLVNLGNVLCDQGKYQEAAEEYRTAIRLDPKGAVPCNGLGNALYHQGELREAAEQYRAAIRLDSSLAQAHNGLGDVLREQGKLREAEQEYRAAIRLDPKSAYPHNGLANILRDRGKREEAEQEYRAAVLRDPKSAQPHNGLGNLLSDLGKLKEAEAEYRTAIRLDAGQSAPHSGLGNVLCAQGKPKEAEAEFSAAIGLDPRDTLPHRGLGFLLYDQGRGPEAEAEFRAAIRLDPGDALSHKGLGFLLYDQGRGPEAEAEYRAAIRLDPGLAAAHNGLGLLLADQGKGAEAEGEFRAAVRLDPGYALPHANLGDVLRDRGRFEEARVEYQQAVGLGLGAAAKGLRQCDRFLALAPRLPAVLRGEDRPADAREVLGFAELCALPFERRPHAAARLYGEALAADPRLADDRKAAHRYYAACCAARAASGQGKDADTLNDREKARLRRQALDWLAADLVLWARQAEGRQPAERAEVRQVLRHWQEDPDLSGVRGDALARLSETERSPWKKLWDDVGAVLAAVSDPVAKR